jgi:hypothetical protein
LKLPIRFSGRFAMSRTLSPHPSGLAHRTPRHITEAFCVLSPVTEGALSAKARIAQVFFRTWATLGKAYKVFAFEVRLSGKWGSNQGKCDRAETGL